MSWCAASCAAPVADRGRRCVSIDCALRSSVTAVSLPVRPPGRRPLTIYPSATVRASAPPHLARTRQDHAGCAASIRRHHQRRARRYAMPAGGCARRAIRSRRRGHGTGPGPAQPATLQACGWGSGEIVPARARSTTGARRWRRWTPGGIIRQEAAGVRGRRARAHQCARQPAREAL